ncbi:N-acyl homoserine lactonase family protein [Rhodococcus sp. WWJCD1]|uniref:N-acyl homoserine lactonase family protein n=1 Tax=Rhodococcus sp. WWJCD1 TaxID=2022519 RepID=UPI000B9BE06E|nr:N-acyl homoserine lactonase family protein [Rhodococcus sp. WWJCD1]OZC45271.1 N-acyl homoserine lactonase family protein [Rhodococcus sp. WWJCD1]
MIDAERPDTPELWRVFAVQYATRTALRSTHFHYHDNRGGEPHPTAYYVWLALSQTDTVLIDAGLAPSTAEGMQGLDYFGSPLEIIGGLGIAPGDIDLCVLTHLHYDHTGVVADLPRARYVVQRRELEYWNGPWATRIEQERWLHSRPDIDHVAASTRLDLVDGDRELLDGLSVHSVGGHTAGMQIVRVRTARGNIVLASDASHFYENIESDNPFAILHYLPDMFGAFDRIQELADGPDHIVPGHDPLVSERFRAVDRQPHVVSLG